MKQVFLAHTQEKIAIIVLAAVLFSMLSCNKSSKQVAIARLNSKDSSFEFSMDTNRLKALMIEGFDIDRSDSNILLTPTAIYYANIMVSDTHTAPVMAYFKERLPKGSQATITFTTTENKSDTGSIFKTRVILAADAEPIHFDGLTKMEAKTQINGIKISKIRSAYWLEERVFMTNCRWHFSFV